METAIINVEQVERKIYFIRGNKVMLDSELAVLYGITTKVFNQAIKRNIERFPEDFCFQLSEDEYDYLRSQIVTSNSTKRGGRRYMPYVFTEQGVAMLSSILNSDRAVQVNIAIMRTFVNMRSLAITNIEVGKRLAAIERKIEQHDESFKSVFGAIKAMLNPPTKPDKQIGYIQKKKK